MSGKIFAAMALLTCSTLSNACDCVKSELSHALAGALMAGAATAGADRYWPEHRALVGFGVSASLGVLGELYQAKTGRNNFSSAALDVISNAGGAAIGAFATDRLILAPVVRHERAGAYYGVVSHLAF